MANLKDDIEKYRKGELTPAEMHALEKKALSDPFLADALEGAESISPQDFEFDISEIDQKILSKSNKTVWFIPLRIAAGLVLLVGSFFLIYTFNQPSEQIALQKATSPSPKTSSLADSISKKDEPKLLSLDQPKEELKTETEADLKTETGPTIAKAKGSGEAKPTTGISTSTQIAPIVTDEPAKSDQIVAAELSEITLDEEKTEREKIATAPVQQEIRKEALDKDMVSRSQAKKSVAADDLQLEKRVVRGQVTSSEDGLPLPGVNVTVKGTTVGTVTDLQGKYSIQVESEKQKLVFSFIGLQNSEVPLDSKSTVNVRLLEDVSQLSEVVITGYKSIRDESETPVIKLAEPFGGRKAYDKYLESNLRFPQQALESNVKGKVTIEFTVYPDGTLLDFNVIKSLGYGCDEEVTRLVKEGPKWLPSTEDNIAIESSVRIKMKFDPTKVKK